MPEIIRKDLCSNPSAKMLEETSVLEEMKEDVNFDEIWMLQYEAQTSEMFNERVQRLDTKRL
jgi:hypothetical protein